MDTPLECRTCSRTDYPASTSQRPALLRNQYPVPLDVRFRSELYRADLDDLPPGQRVKRPCQERREGSLVVYANAITRTEHDDKTGEDTSAKSLT